MLLFSYVFTPFDQKIIRNYIGDKFNIKLLSGDSFFLSKSEKISLTIANLERSTNFLGVT